VLQYSNNSKIQNVVCTADLGQKIDVTKLSELSYGIYDKAIYGGRCGYLKTPEMEGKVTIFPSGKMISAGGKSVQKAKNQLNHAKLFLVQKNMINDTKLIPKIHNIVATVDLQQKLPIDKFSSSISGAVYDPEIFPGLILKGMNSCTFLIFASGKIVCTGGKSTTEIRKSFFELIQRLNSIKI